MLNLDAPADAARLASFVPTPNGGENVPLAWLFTADRSGSRHIVLTVETLLALTLCLLVIRTVAQF